MSKVRQVARTAGLPNVDAPEANGEKLRALPRAGKAKVDREQVQFTARSSPVATFQLDDLIRQGAKFNVLYVDPPWNYGKPGQAWSLAPDRHYPVMFTAKISAIPIRSIAASDSLCWLWVPNCLIPDGLEALNAWGFDCVTSMVWIQSCAHR